MKRIAFPLIILLLPAVACAQAIYECQGQNGPVFTDSPCAGGRQVDLPPSNVIDTEAPAQQPAPQPTGASYMLLAIQSPEEGGTVHTSTGEVRVSLALSPALLEADAISVSLDGTVLPTLRHSLQFEITPDEWESAAADDTQHVLDVAVVDASGNPLITANAVQFYVHRATVRQPQDSAEHER
ncbi:MAG TPA: DUF4124 domain-containing protein [Burkholderiales bacterium]|nr:DUF4124 domain-containing protein [Burkholderiales bacterium]